MSVSKSTRQSQDKLPSVVSKLTAASSTVVGSRISVNAQPAGVPTSASQTASGEAPLHDALLHGKYRKFFDPQYHQAVYDWYYTTADANQRHDFKQLVKEVLEFDPVAAQKALPPTKSGDVVTGNAIVRSHGGVMLRPEVREQAAAFLAYAHPAVQESYRRVFGYVMHIPYMYRETQYTLDYDPARKLTKGEFMHLDPSHKAYAQRLAPKPSEPGCHPCDVIGDGKSNYRTMYAWKVVPPTHANVTQKAHDGTFKGAPFGKMADTFPDMYVTQTKAFFKDTYYDAPQPRRFQNYNDNFTHVMYRAEKLKKSGRLPAETMAKMDRPQPFTPMPAVTPILLTSNAAAAAGGQSSSPALIGSVKGQSGVSVSGVTQLRTNATDAAAQPLAATGGIAHFANASSAPHIGKPPSTTPTPTVK